MDATALEQSTSPAIGPREVGGTGVIVSPIGIDGAVFGWAAGIDETTRVLDAYAGAGGNSSAPPTTTRAAAARS